MSSYEVTFLKEDSSLDQKLEVLARWPNADKDVIRKLKMGIKGEQEVSYHLKKSGLGMYVMRDVNFLCGDLKAQVDFIVITSHHCYFIECKNNNADIIHIDENGNFEESRRYGKRYNKIGIKSPISQAEDQLKVFSKICLNNEEKIKELLKGNRFKNYFKTLVVFTNPDNRINNKKAPYDIKYRILKVDNLIRQIEHDRNNFDGRQLSQEEMKAIGEFILSNNVLVQIPEPSTIEETLDTEIIEEPPIIKKNINTTRSEYQKNKNNKLKPGCKIFLIIYLTLAVLMALGSNLKYFNNVINKGTQVKMTDNQINAINTFKFAYQNSKQKGFSIIDTSVCKDISSVLNNKMLCDKDPIRVNITDNKIRIHKSFYCYNIELGKNWDTLVDAHQVSGFVYSTDQCFEGEKVALGVAEMDESNEYCQKIGGLQKIKDMATYSFVNDAMLDNYYDSSHVAERGGNDKLYTTYKMKVDMYFSAITGKNYNSMAASNTYKDTTNEMCESLYYIMK